VAEGVGKDSLRFYKGMARMSAEVPGLHLGSCLEEGQLAGQRQTGKNLALVLPSQPTIYQVSSK
jgi:hypothetical protein